MAEPKGKAGRPTMLRDPERQAILDAIKIGCPYSDATESVGVSYETFKGWMRQARKDKAARKHSIFTQFALEVKQAGAEFVKNGLKRLEEQAAKTWQTQCWLLERRRPEEFAENRQEIRRLAKQLADMEAMITKLATVNKETSKPEGG